MAVGTYSPTTAVNDLNKLYRKVQGTLYEGMNFHSDEYEMLSQLDEYKIDWSAREITVPVDLNEGAGVASIPEGGYEAFPSSPTVDEITLSWVLFNKRFTATLTSKYIDAKNRSAMLRRQIVHQGKKAIQALAGHVSDYFYGFGTGVLAKPSAHASATSHVITPTNGYGVSTISSAPYIVRLFRVGDRVALLDSAGALKQFGTVTARDKAAGTITVSWAAAVATLVSDLLVKANSLENTTVAGTDYNRGLIGLLDMFTSTSVHGLTHENWVPSVSDSSGGAFAREDLQRLSQDIGDNGGGKLTDILTTAGVKRKMIADSATALRFDDPFNLQLDADVKAKGVNIRTTRRVPPGNLFGFDRKSIRKMVLLKKPAEGDAPMWEDGHKIPDRSAMVFSIDFPMQMVVLNRLNLGRYSGLTEV
jgi:hypothetical protein